MIKEMKIEIMMSTMEKNEIVDLKLSSKNINEITDNVTIINQSSKKNSTIRCKNIRMYSYSEKGLSKSRNRGLEKVNGDIVIIADDDVVYFEDYKSIIEAAYNENQIADIIIFQIETFEGKKFKNYPSSKYFHNHLTILKVSSIEITFRKEKILEKKIEFDTEFGLGSKFPIGEEAIFLKDCLNAGLNILYVPVPIVKHTKESSGDDLTFESLYYKGAVFQRMYGNFSWIVNILFLLKKIRKITNPFKGIYFLMKGSNVVRRKNDI